MSVNEVNSNLIRDHVAPSGREDRATQAAPALPPGGRPGVERRAR